MSKRHLKPIAAPKSWPIKRKEYAFVIKQNPGPHKLEDSMPIGLILKLLSQVRTSREAKYVINQRKVLINKKPAKDIKSQAGLLDVIEFADKYYRILLNKKGKLISKDITKSESNILLFKIIGKTKVKGNRMQLNFHNGFNMLVANKGKEEYNLNDVLVKENDQIKEKINFEKGSTVYIIKGKNLGKTAKIENIGKNPGLNNSITLSVDDRKINLPKSYVFLVGKTKPIITTSPRVIIIDTVLFIPFRSRSRSTRVHSTLNL